MATKEISSCISVFKRACAHTWTSRATLEKKTLVRVTVFKFLFFKTLKKIWMSQPVQMDSKGCAVSMKDALFCVWLKRHPRLECVHQLSIQPCTLTPLASLCLPMRGSGGWQVDPWPSPQPYPSSTPLSCPLLFTCSHSSSPPPLFHLVPSF